MRSQQLNSNQILDLKAVFTSLEMLTLLGHFQELLQLQHL